ncbi:ATP synthase F1 subunit gamma [Natronoflexus pectinivorans]|uniref:ATP synthase gamma chain n=1 Tax=Natronoflexus pectinivorans TaxID=682526 RepID=A0A4R2GNM6_9BACT|nr:ATP synthase F1 subunit gamma [Natronoflexus pectinivorans]TCO10905.1 F-type H+-transporting ATPase subunit gamma [Natronoflexus pectinivorans]
MANLKDIRTRINSVKTTRQVTSAMKMVSAARLKKAQDDISHIRPYTSRLAAIIHDLAATLDKDHPMDYSEPGIGEDVLILAIASNRGLCGGFNINVVKEVQNLISDRYARDYKLGKVKIGIMGNQLDKMFKVRDIRRDFYHHELLQNPTYESAAVLANQLMLDFKEGGFKQVVLVYNEFINAAYQEVQVQQYLPFSVPVAESNELLTEYILEPDAASIIRSLVPKMLQTMLFQVILESLASEHGARMTSMHKATDNATELIKGLQLSYNKARQTAITNQIVEITGGAEALKNG